MADLTKIRALLLERKMTMRELASDIGITEQGLHKLMKENSTKVDTLEKIAEKLNVPVTVFFGDESVPLNRKKDLSETQYLHQLIQNNTILAETNKKLVDRLLELTTKKTESDIVGTV